MDTIGQGAEIEPNNEDQNVITRYQNQYIESMRQESLDDVRLAMREVFGCHISDNEFEALFSLSAHSITHDYALSTNKAVFAFSKVRAPALEFVSVLYRSNHPIGTVHITFVKEKDGIKLEIRHRHLAAEHQGQGIGIDLEWRLQNFCRKYGISAMYNEAKTMESYRGAYVWALYGYEFADPQDCDVLYKQIKYYALTHRIRFLHDPRHFNRPIHFARAKGIDADGEEVPIGKMFLTDTRGVSWLGRRDVALDSEGVRDFIEYAKTRGRNDILDEYTHFLSTLSHNAMEP